MPDLYDQGIAVRTPSWHGKELLLDEPPRDWAHACELARLFEVELQPLRLANGRPVHGWNAVVRTDTDQPVAVVNSSYSLIDIKTMGEIIEETLDGTPWKIDTLFSLREGKMIAACIVLDEPLAVNGDFSHTYPMMTVSNGWTAEHALSESFTSIRAVCANTVNLSEMIAQAEKARWVIKHTRNWRERVEQLKRHLAFARIVQHNLIDLQNDWTRVTVTADQQIDFYRTVSDKAFPRDPKTAHLKLDVRKVWVDQLEHVSRTSNNEVWKGTVQGLWSTYSEWRDHFRPHKTDATLAGRQLIYGDESKRTVFEMASRIADTTLYLEDPELWWSA